MDKMIISIFYTNRNMAQPTSPISPWMTMTGRTLHVLLLPRRNWTPRFIPHTKFSKAGTDNQREGDVNVAIVLGTEIFIVRNVCKTILVHQKRHKVEYHSMLDKTGLFHLLEAIVEGHLAAEYRRSIHVS